MPEMNGEIVLLTILLGKLINWAPRLSVCIVVTVSVCSVVTVEVAVTSCATVT